MLPLRSSFPLVLMLAALAMPVAAQELHFSATGCGPYATDEEPMLEHHVELVNIVGGKVHDSAEWQARLQQDADWVAELCKAWTKPVLYLHADGHVWEVEKAWRAPNLWRVQTDQVRLNPPVLVTVTEDPDHGFCFRSPNRHWVAA